MKILLFLITFLLSTFAMSAMSNDTDYGQFNYYGTEGPQSLNLNTETTRTEYRWVNVPYTERVCRNETRYRQVCHQEPGRQVCRTEPGRQICRQTPPRRVCHQRQGRQICRTIPGRRVCHTRPGRRVCRTVPGRRVCRQVPYNERICRNETRYRQERRAYTVIDTRTNASLTFTFDQALEALGIDVDVRAELNRDHLTVVATDRSTPPQLIRDDVTRNRYGSRDNLTISEQHKVTLTNSEELFSPLRGEFTGAGIANNVFSAKVGKIHLVNELIMNLTVRADGQTVLSRRLILGDFVLAQEVYTTGVSVDLSRLGLTLPTGTTVQVDFSLSIDPSRYLNASQHNNWSKAQTFSLIIH